MEEKIAAFDWTPVSELSSAVFALEYFRIHLGIIIDPHSHITKKRVQGKPAPWLSPEVISLMKKRDKLRSMIHVLQSNERLAAEWEYRELSNCISNLIKNAKAKYFKQLFLNCRRPNEFWRSYFVLTGRNKSQVTISELNVNGISIEDKDEIACNLHSTFAYNDTQTGNIDSYRQDLEHEPVAISDEEVVTALVKLKKKRSDACSAVCYEVF